MLIKAKKRIRLVGAAAVLSSALATPGGAAIADAGAGGAGGGPLKPPPGALLTTADLPRGYQAADEWTDVVRPGEPGPDVCVNPVAVGSVVDRPGASRHASFFRKKDGLLLYEILVDTAEARDLISEVAAAPTTCPTVRIGGLTLTVERMNVLDLGVRASGVLVTSVTEPPIRTRLVVFTQGGVTAVVMVVGVKDPGLRAMHTITLRAARKLAGK